MATPVTTRVWYNTTPITLGRLCMLAAAIILLLFAFNVLKNSVDVSWGWVGIGLFILGYAVG